MPGEAVASWYFGCSACGKCCDSAPRLLLPELFHHQRRFVGCLGLRRRGFSVELFVHAFTFASAAACPALAAEGACGIHDDRKPRVCEIVPLDANLRNDEQAGLLAERQREASFWGADCIRAQPADGFRELTRHLRLVDPEAEAQLARHRFELANERLYWSEATARLLGPELLDHPARVRTIPEQGTLILSLVPALSVMAESSLRCRERVAAFVAEQNRLKAELIEAALARRNAADRADTALLRKLLSTGLAFAKALQATPPVSRAYPVEFLAGLEAWLGLAQAR